MDIDRAQDMYNHDPVFKMLVDTIYSGMVKMEYTASDVRAAAMLAALHFERTRLKPLFIKKTDFDRLA